MCAPCQRYFPRTTRLFLIFFFSSLSSFPYVPSPRTGRTAPLFFSTTQNIEKGGEEEQALYSKGKEGLCRRLVFSVSSFCCCSVIKEEKHVEKEAYKCRCHRCCVSSFLTFTLFFSFFFVLHVGDVLSSVLSSLCAAVRLFFHAPRRRRAVALSLRGRCEASCCCCCCCVLSLHTCRLVG